MGRGARQSEHAVRLAALPRRMRKPQHLGQKRYLVERFNHRSGDRHAEPGHLRATIEQTRRHSVNSIYVVEEIAAADSQGNLHWIPNDDHIHSRDFHNWLDVHDLRAKCDRLNQQPLGQHVLKEIDADGMLNIGISDYRLNGMSEKTTREDSQVKKFDVTNPIEAEQAKDHYRQMSQIVSKKLKEETEAAVRGLKANQPEKAEQLFADEESVKKSQSAKRFADALSQGRADELIAEGEQAKEEKSRQDSQASEEERANRAKRAQDTLRSLAGS